MKFFDRINERVELDKEESDTALVLTLLYKGEMMLKTIVLGLLAGMEEDNNRSKYNHLYRIVRADGIGDWEQVLISMITGPSAHLLIFDVQEEVKQITEKIKSESWQYEAIQSLYNCLDCLGANEDKLPIVTNLLKWFSMFAQLRNKTRGHGATLTDQSSTICIHLQNSISKIESNFTLFTKRQWVYLHKNLSGKYRIGKISDDSTMFDYLKKANFDGTIIDGVHIFYDRPRFVTLLESDVDLLDFYFPNGGFKDKRYEVISYITNDKIHCDSSNYIHPCMPLPSSETQGLKCLDVKDNVLTNMPPLQVGYIRRPDLETSLNTALISDRHQIITMVGRGGIGKTWLALAGLHELSKIDKYTSIIWFSSRDIDLIMNGPKLVRPDVLTIQDISNEFCDLLNQKGSKDEKMIVLSKYLSTAPEGPILFIFDNFETVRDPLEVYNWFDTYIRHPNKILITTRMREFNGDYSIEVTGMSADESRELVIKTSEDVGVRDLITEEYIEQLISESEGHPYIIKIMLGEIAKEHKLTKPERIVATKENILDALFERTYSKLSPVAKRIFISLSSWRSHVPYLALEAVLLRPENEKMAVNDAIDELYKSSLIEITNLSREYEMFISVPLAASIFGKRKLKSSPFKYAIEKDLDLIQAFGATNLTEISKGVSPKIEKLFKTVSDRVAKNNGTHISDYEYILNYIAGKYPRFWLLVSELYSESYQRNDIEKSIEALKRYIESDHTEFLFTAWTRLANQYKKIEDPVSEIHATVEASLMPGVEFSYISNSVNRINSLLKKITIPDAEEKESICKKLSEVMNSRIQEGDATDCSRLAWLYLRLVNETKALELTELGLAIDPTNEYCLKLIANMKKY